MKFVLILGVTLLLQGVVPCEGSQLFDFFQNFLARRANTIISTLRCNERGMSFTSFFKDIIGAHLYVLGCIGWNKPLTDPPSTTPPTMTPLNEIIYWRSISLLLIFFSILFRLKVKIFGKCFLVLKIGRTILYIIKAATEKYPANPSVIPITIGELHSLEKTLMWRWVGLIFLNSRYLWLCFSLTSVIP